MAIDAAEELFAVLEKSNLLTPGQLANARLAAQDDDDPKAIAKVLVQKELLTRWQAGQLLAGRSSFFLGKYKLIEPIGRGGMGSVFLGEHPTMHRRVALKILSRQVGKDPASLERFLSEARAVAALDHPNIVQAYSVDHDADRYYLVMEYIDGRDLQELVEVEGLPDYETAADYIRQAADGLAHGHDRNMIHCDVKPSNLLVSNQGVVKIVDMGLSRLTGQDEDRAGEQDERILGSVDYLAPEQALGSSDFDHRADIYSLGCTLYFLLTGHPPFPEGTLPERIMKHQTQEPRSIQKERRDAPTSLVRICEKMMAKRPEDRFQSAEQLSQVLAEWRLPAHRRDIRDAPPMGAKPKRAVPLKTAEPLDEPVGEGLPLINLNLKPEPTATVAAGKKDPSRKGGFLRTRQRRIVAAVVAVLATGVLAAATVSFLTGWGSDPSRGDQTQARSTPEGANEKGPTGREPTPSEGHGGDKTQPPVDEPPADKPPADQPPADQLPAEETGPDEQPGEKPEPDGPESNQPTKEPKKGPEKRENEPEKRENKDPFSELATAVDLPALRANPGSDGQPSVPVSFGKLYLEPDVPWDIELKGGKDAIARNRQFAIDRQHNGNSWLVHLDFHSKRGTDVKRTDVARIWLDEQTLKFQWLKEAGRAGGNYLRNCGLSVRVNGDTRWLPLTKPKEVKPLVLNLDDGVARTFLTTSEWTPKIGALRLQVTGLEGPFPNCEFRPADRISENGQVAILLSGDKLPNVGLRVALATKGTRASVELAAVYQLVDQVERRFKAKEALQLAGEFFAMQNRWQQTFDKLKHKDPRRDDVKQQIEFFKRGLEQLKALGELYQQIHRSGRIQFRVFHTVDDHQIDLFTTKTTSPEDPDEEEESNPQ